MVQELCYLQTPLWHDEKSIFSIKDSEGSGCPLRWSGTSGFRVAGTTKKTMCIWTGFDEGGGASVALARLHCFLASMDSGE
ncbi:hypothetical protein TanjilG_06390 [Lupinus angustifolius]|uniref:Uncharacterized protein n=1 Tax=Lupinus angustifolius TaxID=3871 RepID=A0A4P1RVA8_LUPAN|nr:hypothetical protein TanjilG_06390 [Lupinus angustifolius]